MNLKETANPDVMESRGSPGCLMLFGLPFFVMGLAVMAASVGLLPNQKNPPPWFVGIPFGGLFATVGAAFIFGRWGVTVNRREASLVKWWGLLVPMKRTEYDLAKFASVSVNREVRRSKNSACTVYPVRLKGDADSADLEAPRDYGDARQTAEQLAKFLSLQMVDESSGKAVVREADELDGSLRDQARRTREAVEVPDTPQGMKTKCEIEGERIVLTTPPAGFGIRHIVIIAPALIIPCIVVFAFALPMWRDEKMPMEMKYICLGFLGLFFVLVPLLFAIVSALRGARRWTRVIASASSLRVENHGLIGTKVVEIPAEEVEELVLPEPGPGEQQVPAFLKSFIKTKGIQARSDAAAVTFGEGLSIPELQWIHAVVRKMLTI